MSHARAPVALLVVAVFISPAALAASGAGYGVDAFVVSAGGWDMWYVYVSAPGTLIADLSWAASLQGADYDLTLYVPGAADDGRLSQSEIIAKSWHHGKEPRYESVTASVTPHARPYVITVEPISAQGQTYELTVSGGDLVRVCGLFSHESGRCIPAVPGVKFG